VFSQLFRFPHASFTRQITSIHSPVKDLKRKFLFSFSFLIHFLARLWSTKKNNGLKSSFLKIVPLGIIFLHASVNRLIDPVFLVSSLAIDLHDEGKAHDTIGLLPHLA
jgi:hypothetical protein